jgi:hypothetical protein
MKRLVAAALFAVVVSLGVPMARAQEMQQTVQSQEVGDVDQYEDAFSNPLRLAYYALYPVGFTVEWLVMRPLHYLISRPYLAHVFGYTPPGEEGNYGRMGEHM